MSYLLPTSYWYLEASKIGVGISENEWPVAVTLKPSMVCTLSDYLFQYKLYQCIIVNTSLSDNTCSYYFRLGSMSYGKASLCDSMSFDPALHLTEISCTYFFICMHIAC